MVIIDSGSFENVVSLEMVQKLKLETVPNMNTNLLINKFISPSCKSLRVLEHAPITHHLPLLHT